MAEKKSLVEETLIQMKDLENVISENAKGILQSTMKEEIGELVKESLMEQDEEPSIGFKDEEDVEVDVEDNLEMPGDEDSDEFEEPTDTDVDQPIDLTQASDEEILKVFKGMGEDDGIIIKKDGNIIDLEDTDEDVEYKIQMGESEEESFDYEIDRHYDRMGDDYEEDEFEPMGKMKMDSDETFFDDEDDENSPMITQEDIVYEIEMGDTNDLEESEDDEYSLEESEDDEYSLEESEDDGEYDLEESEDDEEKVVYEIEMYEEEDVIVPQSQFDDLLNFGESQDDETYKVDEGYKHKKGKATFKYKPQSGGFDEHMKEGPKSVGTGSAKKFKYSDGENAGSKLGKNKIVKKSETKEASRTLGTGRYFGKKGLPKPKAAPRHLRVESNEVELNLLREKNEEYRKALNLFRGKLNEVAVFNSNLAYATRLFTEHSTTKQEKINILRRFDSVETLKESKSLYKTIKDELSSQSSKKPSKESIQEQIERTPSSGSAASLIESKTYENPQFMRMKDLMVKMNIKN